MYYSRENVIHTTRVVYRWELRAPRDFFFFLPVIKTNGDQSLETNLIVSGDTETSIRIIRIPKL